MVKVVMEETRLGFAKWFVADELPESQDHCSFGIFWHGLGTSDPGPYGVRSSLGSSCEHSKGVGEVGEGRT